MDGLDPDKPTTTDGEASDAERWVVFWHFLKNYWSTSHQSKFPWCLGSEGSLENVLTTTIRALKRLFFSSNPALERRLFLCVCLCIVWTLCVCVFFFFQCVLKIITCNEDEVRGEERDRHTQRIQSLRRKKDFFEVNEVNIQKTTPMWFWNWPFASPPVKAK